ncbi:CUB and sushi domain-containing protein 3 [Argiope bruennichi]|uniref:C3/C5 convertase n=1 Tax=Argiope bruennichi TaxID=94029 RepID=A0A8T0E758_ARGBR|nr:CUB and sushi domain-containing protein 3 [Argiope bruennichi]
MREQFGRIGLSKFYLWENAVNEKMLNVRHYAATSLLISLIVCVSSDCPFPEKHLANGRYHYSPELPGHFGRVPEYYLLIFECFPGFIMRGSSTIKCVNGKWTDEVPTCLNCPFPEKKLANGRYLYAPQAPVYRRIVPENYPLFFECFPGFIMRGSRAITCIGGKWTDEVPSCLNCPFPKKNLANGQYIYELPKHANWTIAPENYRLRFRCSPGFTMRGSSVVTCIGGKWTDEVPNCPLPKNNLANGRYIYESPHHVNLKIAPEYYGLRFVCPPGSIIIGSNIITCIGGKWTPEAPICLKMSCMYPPNIANASYTLSSNANNSHSIGTAATYTCDSGYELENSADSVLTCTFNSDINQVQWEGIMPKCIEMKCNNPPSIPNAKYTLHGNTSNPLSIGTTATYACVRGYQLKKSKNAALTCTFYSDINKVKWAGIKPRCIGMECEYPPSIPNASYKLRSRAINPLIIGATATYTCDRGYQLQNSTDSVLTCIFNLSINKTEWKGVTPRCLESCLNPGVSPDGTKSENCCFIGVVLEFSCNYGFELVGRNKIECLPSRNWSALRPLCKPDGDHCGLPPTIPHGDIVGDKKGDYYLPYDEVEIVCQPGYRYSGSTNFIMCEEETGWENEFEECVESFCEPPEPLAHGTVPEIESSNLTVYPFQFEITYICDEGFRLIGNSWRFCDSRGWSGKSPICEAISCPDPEFPEYGTRIGNSFELATKWNSNASLVTSSLDHPKGIACQMENGATNWRDVTIQVTTVLILGSLECLPNREWSGEEAKCLGPYYFDNSAKVRDILIHTVAEKEAEQKQGLEKFRKDLLETWRNGTEIGPSSRALFIPYRKRNIFYFVFDVSGSVGESNFRKSIDFAKGVVRKIGISIYGARVGALTFNSKAKVEFSPLDYETTEEVLAAFDRLNFTGGGTDANTALALIRYELIPLTNAFFEKKGLKSIIFILTDGKGHLGDNAKEEADLLKQDGVEIYWIAVANSVLQNSLYKVASDPKDEHVFILQNYARLSDLVKEITNETIVNGGWSEWSKWDSCSTGCGEGTTNRYRSCNNPIPRNGGKSCEGYSEETKICFSGEECPEKKCEDPPTVPKASYELHSGANELFTIGTTATYICDPGFELENSTDSVLTCTLNSVTNTTQWKGEMPACIVLRCGLRAGKKIGSGKIVGGRIVKDPWPWMTALYIVDLLPKYRCGGSIIHETFILTAAHCLYSNNHSKIDEKEMLVKVGLTDVKNQSFLQTPEVEKIIIHPKYRSGPAFDYDIALLQLKTPIKFNSVVRPICLPPLELPDDTTFYRPREYLVAIGWGISRVVRIMEHPHFLPPDRLKEIILPIQSPQTCRKKEGYLLLLPQNAFSERMFCAGDGRGGNDTCPGDSGGPAMQSQLDENGRIYWTQVGIVSWGIGCGLANTYGYYTHVQKLMDWSLRLMILGGAELQELTTETRQNFNNYVINCKTITKTVEKLECRKVDNNIGREGNDDGQTDSDVNSTTTVQSEIQSTLPLLRVQRNRIGLSDFHLVAHDVNDKMLSIKFYTAICLLISLIVSAVSDCPFPKKKLANGRYLYESPHHVNLTVAPENYLLRFRCFPGFTMKGSKTIVCISNQWTDKVPSCLKMKCVDPPTVPKASYTLNSGPNNLLTIGTTATYTCDPGYELDNSSDSVLTCTLYSDINAVQWKGATPRCIEKESCPDPGVSPDGTKSGNCCFIGDVLEFSCNDEFELVGEHKIECLPGGSWSAPRPLCKRKSKQL